MKKRDGIIWFSLIVILIVVVVVFRDRINFDWAMFWQQLKHANPWHIGAAIALIYVTYGVRALRWAVFVSPAKKVSAGTLVGPMFIGFTAVALFGRLADLTRPLPDRAEDCSAAEFADSGVYDRTDVRPGSGGDYLFVCAGICT